MFELVSGGLADYMAAAFRERGVKFGIGGVARLGCGILPAELVLSEHVRLGSSRVILSRDYAQIFEEYPGTESIAVFYQEMGRFSEHLEHLGTLGRQELLSNAERLKEAVLRIVSVRLEMSGHGLAHHVLAC